MQKPKRMPLVCRVIPGLLRRFGSKILTLGPEALWPGLAMVSTLAPTWCIYRDRYIYIYIHIYKKEKKNKHLS